MCCIAQSAGFCAPPPVSAAAPAESVPPVPRRYRAELIEGRGYSATLVIEAASLRLAGEEAARYAALNGYRLGKIGAGGGARRAW